MLQPVRATVTRPILLLIAVFVTSVLAPVSAQAATDPTTGGTLVVNIDITAAGPGTLNVYADDNLVRSVAVNPADWPENTDGSLAVTVPYLAPGEQVLTYVGADESFQWLLGDDGVTNVWTVDEGETVEADVTTLAPTATMRGKLATSGFVGFPAGARLAQPYLWLKVGEDWRWLPLELTDSAASHRNGTTSWSVSKLVPGLYGVSFEQATSVVESDGKKHNAWTGNGAMTADWFDGAPDALQATTISVTAGSVTSNINGTVTPVTPVKPVGKFAYTDISADKSSRKYNQFTDEITALSLDGIIRGYLSSTGILTFQPRNSVTRDATAAFFYRMAGQPEFTPPATSPFEDVPTTNQFYKEITWLAGQGITTGWDEDGKKYFRPTLPITRDAMAAFLYRRAGSPEFEEPTSPMFADITPTTPFHREIAWMGSTGLSTGYLSDGVRTFRPGNLTSRDAMAAFLCRVTGCLAN